MILLVRISEGLDNGDTDNRGCTVDNLLMELTAVWKLLLY